MRALAMAALAASIWTTTAIAGSLALDGKRVQGGLLVGRTDPGTTVIFEGRPIRVSRAGEFVIGFTRDAAPTATLELRYPDGSQRKETLAVERRTYDIQRIDGLPPRMVTPPKEMLARIERENGLVKQARDRDTAKPYFLKGWIWPSKGRISGVYGSQRILNGEPRRPHFGVDVAAPVGTPIHAAADAIVALAAHDMFFTGHTVILDHGHGLSTLYAHLDAILVREGDEVGRGAPIGRLGGTGRVTGPHLHWGMNLGSLPLDPALVVPPMPSRANGDGATATAPAVTGSTPPSSR